MMKYLFTVVYGIFYPFVFWGRLYSKFFEWIEKSTIESKRWEEIITYYIIGTLGLISIGVLLAFPFLFISAQAFYFAGGVFSIISLILGISIKLAAAT